MAKYLFTTLPIDTPTLRATVERVLADPSFAENARRIGEKLQMYEERPRRRG